MNQTTPGMIIKGTYLVPQASFMSSSAGVSQQGMLTVVGSGSV